MNRVAEVNRELKRRGFEERLTAGRGYYYWRDGNGLDWPSVYVYRANQCSVSWWVSEAEHNKQTRG